ncbi:hypothetical protein [Ramlibacter albus]|uniref:Uncharacterized protein n=1 Tax=Ramlibacter albus TaxID=2079448 RepID=A0A923MAX6_9BURK|nr:hypothetical protein [Ramlibacter albus]MBC5765999.1 hypothetical protein [Ramlibacter albus]
MKDPKSGIAAAAAVAVAVVALLTVWFARHGTGDVPRPSEAISQQSVVTAPPLSGSPDAATRSAVMGGPPAAPAHAKP